MLANLPATAGYKGFKSAGLRLEKHGEIEQNWRIQE
jgi:hypothetical protein